VLSTPGTRSHRWVLPSMRPPQRSKGRWCVAPPSLAAASRSLSRSCTWSLVNHGGRSRCPFLTATCTVFASTGLRSCSGRLQIARETLADEAQRKMLRPFEAPAITPILEGATDVACPSSQLAGDRMGGAANGPFTHKCGSQLRRANRWGPGACERWPLATSRGLSGSSVSRKPSYPFLEINILITIPPHRYADTGERA
jgi:hypothetical protein